MNSKHWCYSQELHILYNILGQIHLGKFTPWVTITTISLHINWYKYFLFYRCILMKVRHITV